MWWSADRQRQRMLPAIISSRLPISAILGNMA
jgi:hypothetical protein